MTHPVDVVALDDLTPGHAHRIELGDRPICVVRLEDDRVFAVHDICTHAFQSLSDGWVDEGRIECPRHGAQFALDSGAALSLPASRPLPTFAVEIRDGRVLVDPTPSHPHPLVD